MQRMPFNPPKKRAQGFDVVRYRRRCGERLGCFGVCAGSRARRGKIVVCLAQLRQHPCLEHHRSMTTSQSLPCEREVARRRRDGGILSCFSKTTTHSYHPQPPHTATQNPSVSLTADSSLWQGSLFVVSSPAIFAHKGTQPTSPHPPPTQRGPQRSRWATAARPHSGRACGRSTCEDGPSSERRAKGRAPSL